MNKNQERGRTMPRRWLQRGTLATLAAIIGVIALSASPALADRKKDKWKHHNHGHYQQHHHYYHDDPRVVYVRPRTVYVEEPVYYVVPRHHPRPIVYERPAINIVVPLFD
jgi:hypothetical protein